MGGVVRRARGGNKTHAQRMEATASVHVLGHYSVRYASFVLLQSLIQECRALRPDRLFMRRQLRSSRGVTLGPR